MAKFPNWGVGTDVSATNLANGIPNIVTKASANSIASNITLANDAELSGIALEAGTWLVEMDLFISGVVASNYKDAWAFTGTLTGTPNRGLHATTAGNTVAANGAVSWAPQVVAYNASTTYGIATAAQYWFRQICTNFVVSVAGNLSLQVAQAVSGATPTVVNIGSQVRCRRIV